MCPPPEGPLPTVLVVEDEPTLRASVVRGLSRAVRATVVGAGTVAEARRALDATPPALMISDIDLPDGTALELFGDLDARGLRIPIVFVSSYVRHYEGRLPTRPGIETHDKPLPLERLKRIVEQALSKIGEPDRSPFMAADYLQLAGIGRKSVLIEVRTPAGEGSIFVCAGSVIAAMDTKGHGMAAFRRIVFAEGDVTCRSLRTGETPAPNLEGSCEELLMEAARQNDEAPSCAEDDVSSGWTVPPPRFASSPPPAAAPSIPPEKPVSASLHSFENAYESGVEALLDRRYEEALRLFTRARELRPDDSRVNANLARLPALLYREKEG